MTRAKRYKRAAIRLTAFAGAVAFIFVGYLLRRVNIVFNPVPWASIQVISSFVSFSIAANILVRFFGTNNRTSLLLGSTFGVLGFAQLTAIAEFHHRVATSATLAPVSLPLFSWMIGQTLLALILLLAFPLEKWLPWPRQRRKVIIATTSVVAAGCYLISATYLALLPRLALARFSVLPRPSNLIPAAIFAGAAVVLYRNAYRNRSAFDTMLIWVAAANAACHLIASGSAQTLDMPAVTAQLLNTGSFAMLAGATLIDNVRLFGEVRDRAISDSLTGLANYRQLVDVLQTELERSGRTNRPFAILLIDLDGLKEINDQQGHLAGNRAICRVAEVLRLHSRSLDTAARYGGDEFALILPETNDDAARQVAARIRKHLALEEEMPRLSVSIGVAAYPDNGASAQDLLDAADQQLYAAKLLSKKTRIARQLPLGI